MKNIILIITDTFRFDNLHGRARRTVNTPYLNGFANERAISMDNCYTGSFPTIPHRTDVATGVVGWPHYGWQAIDLSGPNHVAGALGDAGYATQLICDCPHLFKARFQFAFEAAFHNRGQEGDRSLLHLNHPIKDVVPDAKTRTRPKHRGHTLPSGHRWENRYNELEQGTYASKTSGLAVRWLEENYLAEPFFLWVDFFDPHEPWDPPEYMVRKYDPDYRGTPMIHPNYGPSSAYTEAELQNLWAHYAAEAEIVDRSIGRILEKIDDLQLWDDSVVIVTTDHGFSIGEHERTGKTNIHDSDERYWPIYPEVGRVPLLFAGAGAAAGETSEALIQPVDIMPTAATLAGVELDMPKAMDGRSYAEIVRGAGTGPGERNYVVTGSHLKPDAGSTAFPAKSATPFLVTDTWAYAPVGAEGRRELYSIVQDPYAEHDVSGDHPDVVKELDALLLRYLRDHGAADSFVDLFEGAIGGPGSHARDYS